MSDTPENVSRPEKVVKSPWSFHLATVADIPIRVHFTFILFLVWVGLAGQERGLLWPLFVIMLFACVVLHELGHALTARHFNVKTRDITLYPIGGVAMLQSQPKPKAELWIALAGPAVNFVIAGLLLPFILLGESHVPALGTIVSSKTFIDAMFSANLVLGLFNLVPAFPMDGGRVLRAALAIRMPYAEATRIAGGIGQALAIAFLFAGILLGNVLWMLIAFFVFLGAGQEVSEAATRTLLTGHKISDAMLTRFQTLVSGDSLDDAAQLLLAESQHDFPVVNGDEVVGVLSRGDIAQGLASDGPSGYVAGHMHRNYQSAEPNVPLEKAFELLSDDGSIPILVMDNGRLLGMVTRENLMEFIMLEHARARAHSFGH